MTKENDTPMPIDKPELPRGRPRKTTSKGKAGPSRTANPDSSHLADSPSVGREKIRSATIAVWLRLNDAVNKQLDRVESGDAELSPATVTAITNFFKASQSLADDTPEETSQSYIDGLSLPTFDDEGEDNILGPHSS